METTNNTHENIKNQEPLFKEDISILNEDAELLFVRNIRLEAIRQSMANGKIPSDPDQAEVLVKLLKDMDQSALTRKKLKAEQEQSQQLGDMTSVVAELLKNLNGQSGLINPEENKNKQIEEIPEDKEVKDLLPGELEQGIVNDNYENFMQRMKKE